MQSVFDRRRGDDASLARLLGVSERTLYRKIRMLK
ncbi:helix-turn-helix domain-containing protein [Hahella chejuensis]